LKERFTYNGDNYYVFHDERDKIGKIINKDYEIIDENSEEYKQISLQFQIFHKLV
jgi:hypothetical protein